MERCQLILSLALCLPLAACVPNPMQSNLPVAAATTGASPAVIPTMAATPYPGQYVSQILPMTVLGKVPCSGSTVGASAYILRTAADWNAYLGNTACANPSGYVSLSSFNFAAQSVLILQLQDCGNLISTDMAIWHVYQMNGYLYAGSDIGSAGTESPNQMGCNSYAVAIPATTQGATWTICEQLPSYHCLTAVTP
jgi:hypothetical protein